VWLQRAERPAPDRLDPKSPGDYDMDLGRNMTFVAGDRNLVSFDGRIVVDQVTPTR